jgi:hypothetical protein
MDPDRVASIRSTLGSHIASFDVATDALSRVRLASLNPASYGVAPGSLILAPASIATITSALARLGAAKANASSLVADLDTQVDQQLVASAAADDSYYSFTARDGLTPSGVAADTDPWWAELNESLEQGVDAVQPFFDISDYYKAAWLIANARDIRSIGALAGASDWAIAEAPRALQVAGAIADSPVGKGLRFSALSLLP